MSNSSTAPKPFVAPMPVIMRALGLEGGPRGIADGGDHDANADPPGADADRAA